ncbi:MAG: PilW family protein [Gemmatimonadaceae bacterium]
MSLNSSRNRRSRRNSAGFSLTELMIVIVLLGIVMGTLMTVIVRQQRFYRGAADVMDTRGQIRQAVDLLVADLRGVSTANPASLDITQMDDRSISYRSTFGSSVACVIGAGRLTLILPPENVAKGNSLTRWLSQPAAGDSLFVYADSGEIGNPGVWIPAEVANVVPLVGGCPASTGLTTAADAASNSYTVTLSSALPAYVATGVGAGNPVRFFRPVRYALYQPGSDWYLGYSECRGGVGCSALEPIAGPYRPYIAAGAANGVTLAYFDSLGAATANRREVAQFRLILRGESGEPVSLSGGRASIFRDSLDVRIAVRNRN